MKSSGLSSSLEASSELSCFSGFIIILIRFDTDALGEPTSDFLGEPLFDFRGESVCDFLAFGVIAILNFACGERGDMGGDAISSSFIVSRILGDRAPGESGYIIERALNKPGDSVPSPFLTTFLTRAFSRYLLILLSSAAYSAPASRPDFMVGFSINMYLCRVFTSMLN